jgi:hypothetical protein
LQAIPVGWLSSTNFALSQAPMIEEELTMHEDDVRLRMVANCLTDDVRSIRGHDSLLF